MAKLVSFTLVLISVFIVSFKVYFGGYSPKLFIPERSYLYSVSMTGHSSEVETNIETFVPREDLRTRITDESYQSGNFKFLIQQDTANKRLIFQSVDAPNNFRVGYAARVQPKAMKWDIPAKLKISSIEYSDHPHLASSRLINLQSPAIKAAHQNVVGSETDAIAIVKKVYDFVSGFENVEFKGSTSAETALKLGKASCNGKGRLFVALLRISKIPARLVGGVVLNSGAKKTSHQWVEVKLLDEWVVFDPTNKHFAKIPENYLKLYEGDEVLFKHTPDIGFNWVFNIGVTTDVSSEIYQIGSSKFNALSVLEIMKKTGVPLGIIKYLLMLPLGALIVTFFRNVIGLQTFGTFLPALIAAAARQTGIIWGGLAFISIILVVSTVRQIFKKLDLMHTPKLSAMMSVVVILLIGLSTIASSISFVNLANISLFPIAVLTLTSERFALTVEEDGFSKAIRLLLQSVFVIAFCYLFMSNLFVETILLAFPEVSLTIIGANIWLGQWVGLRLTEVYRFRNLIFKGN